MQIAIDDGVEFLVNPKTKSQVSGETNGGFRPQDCPIGAPLSAHKNCQAVDIFDPVGKIDDWLNNSKVAREAIKELDMYFEDKSATVGWSHWQTRKTNSGRRFFLPYPC